MPSNGALDRAAVGAKKDSGKKRRKSSSSESDDSDSSEDSDAALNKHVQKQSKKELKKALEKCRQDEAAITKKIAEQKAKNEKKLLELSAVRNNYPVLHIYTPIPLLLLGIISFHCLCRPLHQFLWRCRPLPCPTRLTG
jgi:hypothetical protein